MSCIHCGAGGPLSSEACTCAEESEETYCIKRFRFQGETTIIATGLTLDEAQEHCNDESTHGDGWFDGYDAE